MSQSSRLLSDHVYDQLLGLIGSDAYAADARLPGENELAKQLNVSRPVLRQALIRLRTEGRIYSRKGSGNYVGEIEPQAEIVEFGSLTNIADIRSFLEYRCSVEGEIAARAAQHRSPAELAEIRLRRQWFEDALAHGQAGIEEDIAFHKAIAQACGNRFFVMTLAALTAQTRFSINLVRQLSQRAIDARFEEVCREHQLIEQAIDAQNPAEARAAMNAHLVGGMDRLFGQ